MDIIGLDIGYGYTKLVTRNRRIVFPSVLGQYEALGHQGILRRAPDPLVVDGNKWYVGKPALLHSRDARRILARDRTPQHYKIFLRWALRELGFSGEVVIYTGLPVSWYKDADAAVLHDLEGVHSTNGTFVNVTDVKVMPQPFGAYLSQILNDDGIAVHNHEQAGIIDIGYYTSDLLYIVDNEVSAGRSTGIDIGMSSAVDEICQRIEDQHNLSIDKHREIEEILRTWRVQTSDGSIDVSTIVDSALNRLGALINDQMAEIWPRSYRRRATVMLAGGGGLALQDYVHYDLLVNDSQFANAIGFYRMGVLQHG